MNNLATNQPLSQLIQTLSTQVPFKDDLEDQVQSQKFFNSLLKAQLVDHTLTEDEVQMITQHLSDQFNTDFNITLTTIKYNADHNANYFEHTTPIETLMGQYRDRTKELAGQPKPAKNGHKTVDIAFIADGEMTNWSIDYLLTVDRSLDISGFTDRMYEMMKNHIIYDLDRGAWQVFNSKRYVTIDDQSPAMRQLIVQVRKLVFEEVNANPEIFIGQHDLVYATVSDDHDDDKSGKTKKPNRALANQYNRFINDIQRETTIKTVFKNLQSPSYLGRSHLEFDPDDQLLNVNNGVINLTTGELQKHDYRLMMSKICPVDYRPDAKHPVLDQMLKVTFQDHPELIDYIQSQAGYFLLGGNPDQHLFFFHGEGRNGKSVLTSIFLKILGDWLPNGAGYSREVNVANFMKARLGGDATTANSELAGLQGARLVITGEPEKGARLNESLLKSLTGDSRMTARFLHQNATTFDVKFKILMACNFLPLSNGDEAIRRRLIITPFTHQIKVGSVEDNPTLPQDLWAEKEGILAWMVEGALKNEQKAAQAKAAKAQGQAVVQDRLYPLPAIMRSQLNNYIFRANTVSQFLADTLITKSEWWKIYVDKFIDGHFDATTWLQRHNRTSDSVSNQLKQEEMEEAVFGTQYLVADENASISRKDLYKMYQNYCDEMGITRPANANNFYDDMDRFMISGKVHGDRRYFGIYATPMAGTAPATKDKHNFNTVRWVKAPENYKVSLIENISYGKTENAFANHGINLPEYDRVSAKKRSEVMHLVSQSDQAYLNRIQLDPAKIIAQLKADKYIE